MNLLKTQKSRFKVEFFIFLYSRLNTARGSCTSLVTVGPAKVKAYRSVLFTEIKKLAKLRV